MKGKSLQRLRANWRYRDRQGQDQGDRKVEALHNSPQGRPITEGCLGKFLKNFEKNRVFSSIRPSRPVPSCDC